MNTKMEMKQNFFNCNNLKTKVFYTAVGFGGDAFIHQRGVGVAEMKRSVRRGREAEHGDSLEDFIGHGGKANT